MHMRHEGHCGVGRKVKLPCAMCSQLWGHIGTRAPKWSQREKEHSISSPHCLLYFENNKLTSRNTYEHVVFVTALALHCRKCKHLQRYLSVSLLDFCIDNDFMAPGILNHTILYDNTRRDNTNATHFQTIISNRTVNCIRQSVAYNCFEIN